MPFNLSSYLRDVPDFPKPGILFKDITPLLASPEALREAIKCMAALEWEEEIDRVVGIESRGFLFGVPLAMELELGFTPIRKLGKLPWRTKSVEYSLEYGSDTLEIHQDGVEAGGRVLLVDDLLATGGTMRAACELIEGIGGHVVGCVFLVELTALGGRRQLANRHLESLIEVD